MNKESQVADNEKNHSKSYAISNMKGVSVGLFSPDRKERYCKSMDVGDGIILSFHKQQQQPPPPQSSPQPEIACSQQEEFFLLQ